MPKPEDNPYFVHFEPLFNDIIERYTKMIDTAPPPDSLERAVNFVSASTLPIMHMIEVFHNVMITRFRKDYADSVLHSIATQMVALALVEEPVTDEQKEYLLRRVADAYARFKVAGITKQ